MKFFVSGTDTNIGKTAATGWLARRYAERGLKVATQKLVQTGCGGISEDILEHRRIMGCGVLPCDADFTTCRYVFKYPASPHLAAAMEGATLDLDALASDTAKLEEAFDVVLVEGAGGLGVPLKEGFTTADYIAKYAMPYDIEFRPELPKTLVGKVAYRVLEEEEAERQALEDAKNS